MEFSDWFKLKKKQYRLLTMESHEITSVVHTNGQRFSITETILYLYTYNSDNHLLRRLRSDLLSPKFGSQKSALL